MIRDALAQDATAIAEIWNPVIRDSAITFNPVEKTAQEIISLIEQARADRHAFLVADEGGQVRGFARYFQFRGGQGYARCMEHTIYLHPQAHGRGMGHALMAALETYARGRGMRMLIGALTASNAPSIAFHHRLGFTEVGRIPDAGWKFGIYHDLVLMQKLLLTD